MLAEEERKEGMARSNTKGDLSTSVWDRLYMQSSDRRQLLGNGSSAANQQRFQRTTLWDAEEPEKAPAARPQTVTVHQEYGAGAGASTPNKSSGRTTYSQHNKSKLSLAYEDGAFEKTPPPRRTPAVSSPITLDEGPTSGKAQAPVSTRIKTFEQKYRSGFQLDDSRKPEEVVNTRIKTFKG